jgi:hypothetical protein
MTLTLHKLNTHARIPSRTRHMASLVDDASSGLLAREIGAQLGLSLDHGPAVARINRLQVNLRVPARALTATKLAEGWAREFIRALHLALAYPDGAGPNDIRRFGTRVQYSAALLQHLLTEGTTATWIFPELKAWQGQSSAEAAHQFLLSRAERIGDILAELARSGWLEPLLAIWDEQRMEQLMRAVAEQEGHDRGLTLHSLLALANLATQRYGLYPQWQVSSRRQAMRLWARHSGRFSIRSVWYGLRFLARLLEQPALLLGERVKLDDPIPFPEWCQELLNHIARYRNEARTHELELTLGAASSTPAGTMSVGGVSPAAGLVAALDSLRPLVPSSATPGEKGRWIHSDCCGILLLLSTVERMDLWRLASQPELVRSSGPRAFSFLLAATGSKLLGPWDSDERIDAAVALFAGSISELDYLGLQQFFSKASPSAIAAAFSRATWTETLEALATELSYRFAQRVRGFRESSREAVVKQFLRRPGRVLIEQKRILVVLEPSPWSIALHLSGLDAFLESIEWLEKRRVDFVLEGL